jgi:hypothetical protein
LQQWFRQKEFITYSWRIKIAVIILNRICPVECCFLICTSIIYIEVQRNVSLICQSEISFSKLTFLYLTFISYIKGSSLCKVWVD